MQMMYYNVVLNTILTTIVNHFCHGITFLKNRKSLLMNNPETMREVLLWKLTSSNHSQQVIGVKDKLDPSKKEVFFTIWSISLFCPKLTTG